MDREMLVDFFEEVETIQEYDGYFCSVAEAVSIVVLGSLCGLRNVSQIHQWAKSENTRRYLEEKYGITHIPCYYWLLSLLKLVKPESLNQCLVKWAESVLPEDRKGLTIALDGKTIRSTGKMSSYKNPLHIISAQLSELGITFASKAVDGKTNEIPTVQELIAELNIKGCIVVADALNCQRETAEAIIKGKGDYLLDAKGNQASLEEEIRDYVQDDGLRKQMDCAQTSEKSRDRLEKRTAYVTTDIEWMNEKPKWKNLACIGAIKTEFDRKGEKTEEWHYYISSRPLTALELLHHARMEWAVEAMHWLLDVHFGEDFCRIQDKTIQRNLNMLRKFVLSLIKQYKERQMSKRAISKIMFDCLLDCGMISVVLEN
jgi:predicted transposase YbfD/YdcC